MVVFAEGVMLCCWRLVIMGRQREGGIMMAGMIVGYRRRYFLALELREFKI